METYGLSNNSPQTSVKQRVQVDDIKVVDVGFDNIVNSTMKEFKFLHSTMKEFTIPVPVLHGASVECDVGTEWDVVDELAPILSHIGQ